MKMIRPRPSRLSSEHDQRRENGLINRLGLFNRSGRIRPHRPGVWSAAAKKALREILTDSDIVFLLQHWVIAELKRAKLTVAERRHPAGDDQQSPRRNRKRR
jgi:hypothetical protein